MDVKGKIIISTNSAWTLYHFRLSLMLALVERGFEVIAAAPVDQHARTFDQHDIRFVNVGMSVSGRNPFKELKTIFDYICLYSRERPVLVHHFSAKAVLFGSIAARLVRVPSIINTMTGLGYTFSQQRGAYLWLVKALARFALRPPMRIIFQNPNDREFFLANNLVLPEQTGLILGSGIDIKRFAPEKDSPVKSDNNPLRFLMYSRMIWEKGVQEYFEAAEIIGKRYPKGTAEFTLLGGAMPGNSTNVELEWITNPRTIPGEWLKEKADRGFVKWFPHDNNVLPYVKNADVVVLPSYYPEGLPRSLLESMACGKAIITTDSPGCSHVVKNGVTGLVVKARDVESLAQAMAWMIDNPDHVIEMGKASRQRIMEKFSDEHVIEQTFREYAKAGLRI